MKKQFVFAIIIFGGIGSSNIQSASFMESCRYYIATTLISAVNSVLEMAATSLAMQGDSVAAEALINIQNSKTPRQLFCEAGTTEVSGMFNYLIHSLPVSPAVRSAIENALYSAVYKVMGITISKSWF